MNYESVNDEGDRVAHSGFWYGTFLLASIESLIYILLNKEDDRENERAD